MGFLRFLWEDFKGDVRFIRKVFRGEVDFGKKLSVMRSVSFGEVLKENWLFFLIVLLAFCAGFLVASQYYEGVCNSFIVENFGVSRDLVSSGLRVNGSGIDFGSLLG